MNCFFATSNSGKLREAQNFFPTQKIFGCQDLKINWPCPKENSDYFLMNGLEKLFLFSKILEENNSWLQKNSIQTLFVDDSGLCVPSFNFEPGV